MYVVGSLSRARILNSKGTIKLIMSSNDNFDKVVILCDLVKIDQNNTSMKSLYKIRHRLLFTDDTPCDDVIYDL